MRGAPVLLLALLAGCAHIRIPDGVDHTRSLPLRVLPAPGAGRALAVVLSGDGPLLGRGGELGASIRKAGIPTVVWQSAPYYWTPRTPDEAARDLDLVIRHFGALWGRRRVVVVGFSMGADIAPFLVNRLPADTRARVAGVVLASVARGAVFEFRVQQWWREPDTTQWPVRPEVERLRGTPVLCIAGRGDPYAACQEMGEVGARVLELRGGHHFSGDYPRLASAVVDAARQVNGGE